MPLMGLGILNVFPTTEHSERGSCICWTECLGRSKGASRNPSVPICDLAHCKFLPLWGHHLESLWRKSAVDICSMPKGHLTFPANRQPTLHSHGWKARS